MTAQTCAYRREPLITCGLEHPESVAVGEALRGAAAEAGGRRAGWPACVRIIAASAVSGHGLSHICGCHDGGREVGDGAHVML